MCPFHKSAIHSPLYAFSFALFAPLVLQDLCFLSLTRSEAAALHAHHDSITRWGWAWIGSLDTSPMSVDTPSSTLIRLTHVPLVLGVPLPVDSLQVRMAGGGGPPAYRRGNFLMTVVMRMNFSPFVAHTKHKPGSVYVYIDDVLYVCGDPLACGNISAHACPPSHLSKHPSLAALPDPTGPRAIQRPPTARHTWGCHGHTPGRCGDRAQVQGLPDGCHVWGRGREASRTGDDQVGAPTRGG